MNIVTLVGIAKRNLEYPPQGPSSRHAFPHIKKQADFSDEEKSIESVGLFGAEGGA